ncbi:putative 1-acyl-sn-glycerol-3-phosphate acyltransferase acl-2 [Teleopsis dalmanni]|uniref:putative 1-acyl-sn-glycerol-3-phosphate acyltransferase acl-2 n=1 Tax=Teleopsis dalmanni TaxID=139649 RepID=UPI0018CE89EE|nr:putative 1-acyl-sn-glycerol-3-phosphate acyltransferase acl-2 [Teleopsis dalmanni]XP_037928559.1 putative 1-acyl-sn-glycerol-3-phosphate acyltransferase acl-2 [Teleopsis dalmanni]XP_037928560.1 putative 1-acyl-sn-glycerol-3-phosphate acyltransferase acl-2 [Teleopsis dalmanni]XP_037928561.1 putative 1-acyl-sn-glycerol-3-phosphate acyltransferase acl-2 [Teleopsis dalmanni]XP_037929408.1 putative 1-acyl-sn-glycerol-3-phosphate acyltransferase acl-2 [Teleopsis dalmanni]XP_037929409.1 putative 1
MGCVYEAFGITCIIVLILASYRAPYTLKMGTFLIGSAVIVLICIPFMLLRPRNYRNALVPAWCCRLLCRGLGVTMEVRGLENVRKESDTILIMNHQSVLDLCVLAYLWPVLGQVTVVTNKKIFYIPIFGFGAWLWGTMFRNVSQISGSMIILQSNTSNVKGLQCQCPIQPVVISKFWFLNSEMKIFESGHVIIHIMPRIHTKGSDTDDLDSRIKQLRDVTKEEFSKLTQEVQ